MGVYIPIDEAVELPVSTVGQKAKLLASQKDKLPFTLILTSDVFKKFIAYNNLEPNLRIALNNMELSTNSLAVGFAELAKEFQKARFPQDVQEQLKECFDLLCLDTAKLNLLSNEKPKHTILGVLRSIEGEDNDAISYKLWATKDSFEHFLNTIKKAYLSLYTPSAVVRRINEEIPFPALIIYRLPNMMTCFESMANPATKQIKVRSYTGFLDFTGSIKRDMFDVAYDFLKIEKSNIVPQDRVSVFDLHHNNVVSKKYDAKMSAQSATDQMILEVARLTKKFASDISAQAIFVSDNNNHLYLVDVFKKEGSLPEEEEAPERDIESLRAQVIEFIKQYEDEPAYKDTINILLRSLKTDNSAQTLVQGIGLCKELLEKHH